MLKILPNSNEQQAVDGRSVSPLTLVPYSFVLQVPVTDYKICCWSKRWWKTYGCGSFAHIIVIVCVCLTMVGYLMYHRNKFCISSFSVPLTIDPAFQTYFPLFEPLKKEEKNPQTLKNCNSLWKIYTVVIFRGKGELYCVHCCCKWNVLYSMLNNCSVKCQCEFRNPQ